MSHFVALVLTAEAPKDEDHAKEMIEKLLAPYSEDLEVPAYKKPCYCLASQVRSAGCQAAEAFKPIDQLRDEFWKMPEPAALQAERKAYERIFYGWDGVERRDLTEAEEKRFGEIEERTDELWNQATAERKRIEAEAEDAAKETVKPKADCDGCHGTGEEESTYNPKSKWDWWVIGGRWAGYFLTREEKEKVFAGMDDLRHTYGPHDLRGLRGNVAPVSEVGDKVPRVIVTPDGEWFERGRMGWFGMSSGDKPKAEWAAEVAALFEKHAGATAIAVDCHI